MSRQLQVEERDAEAGYGPNDLVERREAAPMSNETV
jgi:hypothetical protein